MKLKYKWKIHWLIRYPKTNISSNYWRCEDKKSSQSNIQKYDDDIEIGFEAAMAPWLSKMGNSYTKNKHWRSLSEKLIAFFYP